MTYIRANIYKKASKVWHSELKCRIKDATLTDEIVEEQMNSIRNNLKKSIAELSFRE